MTETDRPAPALGADAPAPGAPLEDDPRARLESHLARVCGPGPVARLDEALTHPSLPNEDKAAGPHYERLEFLGDAVLGHAVARLLFERFPQASEGQLTRMRAALVNAAALAAWARRMRLGEVLRLGKGAEAAGEADATSVLCDVTEAILGAIYLERGFDAAQAFVRELVGASIDDVDLLDARDPKSAFQELAQAHKLGTPVYRGASEASDSKRPSTRVEVILGERVYAVGEGESKRAAERAAASEALRVLRAELGPKAP
jgi:ribonuclease-3